MTGQPYADLLEMDGHQLRTLRVAWNVHVHESNERARLSRGR